MKKVLYSVFVSVFVFACGDQSNHIGKPIETQNAISVKEGLKQFHESNKTKEVIIYGKVADVCETEGCWFAYELSDSTLTVDFNNEFTVPKNIRRKDMYAVGHFYKDTLVTAEEDSTTQSKSKLTVKFRAHGVKFK